MRGRSLLCLLAAFAFVCTAPVLAEEATDFRFYDEQGTLLNNVSIASHTSQASSKETVTNGILTLAIGEGQKVIFEVPGFGPQQVVVPTGIAVGETVDVVLETSGAGNGDCTLAEAINVGDTVQGNTAVDGAAQNAPFCGTSVSALGVWFSIDGTGETLTASTCNQAAYDTKLNIYCADCENFTCVDGNDDGPGCSAFSSEVSWCSEVDASYLILVQGFGGETGAFNLTVSGAGDSCDVGSGTSCLPPEPTGACCNCLNEPFNCTVGTLSDCLALGGDFQGDGSQCSILTNFSAPGQAIPDGGFPNYVSDSLVVGGKPTITDVNVGVVTTHTWIGDVYHVVEHPNTVQSGLWVGNCDVGAFAGIDTEFDDEGTAQFCNSTGPTPAPNDGNGNIIALGGPPLSTYDGTDPNGTWTMYSADDFPADTGTLDLWYLRLNDLPFPTICVPGGDDDDDDSFFTTLCHCPPGLAGENCHTITVGGHAADAHLANHGYDYLGECNNGTAMHHDLVGEGQNGGNVGFGMDSSNSDNSDEADTATTLRRRTR